MRLRHTLSSLFLILSIFIIPTYSQRLDTRVGGMTELRIRVMFENDRSVAVPVNVQLLSNAGTPIQEGMSNDRGEVSFRSLPAGDYRIKVSGSGIQQTEAELTSTDTSMTQFVRVTPLANSSYSSNGFVSAKQLNLPDKARKEFDKGTRALNESDLSGAKKHLEKALELAPGYAAALNNLGVVAIREEANQRAHDYFQMAVKADDTYVQALINLAKSEMLNKNVREALGPLERAKSLTPTDAQVFNLLATVQAQLEDLDHALINARKVHTLEHGKYAISHFIAASILAHDGRKQEAAAEYRLFLKEAPDSPSAKLAKAKLSELE